MLKHLLWDMTGKLGGQAVSLFFSLVLTRLLNPEEFGIVAIAVVITAISSVVSDMGFSRAIIQQKNVSKDEYSATFFLNVFIGILLGVVCFFLSDSIAVYYQQPALRQILQILSFLFLINSFSLVPLAMLTREMKFKKISIIGLLSAVISGVVSIVMAKNGYGAWSLVAQFFLYSIISTVLYYIVTKWLPLLHFKFNTLKTLWLYGSRLFASGLLNTLVTRLDIFIIGKIFTTATLGYYTRAQSIDSIIRTTSSGSLASVFFPLAARLQNNKYELQALYNRYLHLVSFAAAIIAGLLYLIVPDLFRILFTAKWDTAAAFFQLMAIAGFAWPASALMVTLISGSGNSKAYLKAETIKTIILIPVYIIGLSLGIIYFLWIMIGIRFLFLCINSWFVSKEINISVIKQLSVVFSSAAQVFITVVFCLLTLHFIQIENTIVHFFASLFLFSFVFLIQQYIFPGIALKEIIFLLKKNWNTLKKLK